jgi:hypothetical protein
VVAELLLQRLALGLFLEIAEHLQHVLLHRQRRAKLDVDELLR